MRTEGTPISGNLHILCFNALVLSISIGKKKRPCLQEGVRGEVGSPGEMVHHPGGGVSDQQLVVIKESYIMLYI